MGFPDSQQWRPDIIRISNVLYDEIGEDAGWKGIPPWPIVEATVSRESNGNPNVETSGAGAIGLMQVTPDGWEAGEYTKYTHKQVTADSLGNREENMRVGITGLAQRHLSLVPYGYPGWQYAPQAYFGAFDYENGVPLDAGGPGTDNETGITGKEYRDYVMSYINDMTKDDAEAQHQTWDFLGAGGWFKKDGTPDPGTVKPMKVDKVADYLNKITNAPGTVVGAVGAVADSADALGRVSDFIDGVQNPDNWIRALLGLAGIAVVLVGIAVTVL